MGKLLTTQSQLMCPHGGTVVAISTNTRMMAANAPVLTVADTFMVVGCPFTLPGPVPSPCLTVQWVVSDLMLKLNGAPTLSDTSVGLCLSPASAPQGTVIVAFTQPIVSSL